MFALIFLFAFLALVGTSAYLLVAHRRSGEGDFVFHVADTPTSPSSSPPVVDIVIGEARRAEWEEETPRSSELMDLDDPTTNAFDPFDPISQEFYGF